MIHRFNPKKYFLTYGSNEPSYHVNPGDQIIAKTVDAGGIDSNGEQISDDMRQKIEGTILNQSNPLTGPFYVEGAEPGDTLVVEIQKITLTRPTAWSRIGPNFGVLTDEVPGKKILFNDPIARQTFEWSLDSERMLGKLELKKSKLPSVEIILHPFLGSIGVAPRYGRVEIALTPGEYGGNMDCPEYQAGVKAFFPVFYEGGYLVFGDCHAAQGDGEICGVALETSSEVTMRLDVIKGKKIEWPRLEDNDWIMTVGSARPLIEAYKIAHYELHRWMMDEYGFEKWEGLQLLSQVGRCRVGNIVDPRYSVVAKFPKRLLQLIK